METLRLTPEVHAVLSAAACDGNKLVLTGQLDRKLYVQVNKALELMGGSWNRKARAHVFEDSADDVVADAIATGAVLDLKKHFQFFETPPAVAELLIELADLEGAALDNQAFTILEPSAGRGALVRAIRAAGFEPVACELWDRNRQELEKLNVEILSADFFAPTGRRFDRIIANPPFTRGQDVEHVTRMIELTAPCGRLASVMSPGWRFRQDKRAQAFKALAERHNAEWHELPAGSFAASGTNVNAGIIVIEKD
jgi:hypothetical protein